MGRTAVNDQTWCPIDADRLPKDKYIRKESGGYTVSLRDRLPNGKTMPGKTRWAKTQAEAKVLRAELVAEFNRLGEESLKGWAELTRAMDRVWPDQKPIRHTFREAVEDEKLLGAWLEDMGKTEHQRKTILRELKGRPCAVLGKYPLDQIGVAQWTEFKEAVLSSTTHQAMRRDMTPEDALRYKADKKRAYRQAKTPEGGTRYKSRPRKGPEVTMPEPRTVGPARVKRLRAYVHNLFDAAVNRGVLERNPWAGIKYQPDQRGSAAGRGRSDEEGPAAVRLTRPEVRGFAGDGQDVAARLAILQGVFGLRIGEAMGCPYANLRAIQGHTVCDVTHQVRVEVGKPKRTTRLKTPKSRRSVLATPMDADLVALLGEGAPNEYVATQGTKTPDPRDVHDKYLTALIRAGLTHREDRPDVSPHAFRSYAITRWLNYE